MKTAMYAFGFGIIGMIVGGLVASGSGITSLQPVWVFSGGAWLAILGAVLGGTRDIIDAIRVSADRNGSGRGKAE